VTTLLERKWQEIHDTTQEVIASINNDFDPAEDGDIDDLSEMVQISESEED
jgi:hypothetical protein